MIAYLTSYTGRPYGEPDFAPEETIEHRDDEDLRRILRRKVDQSLKHLHWLRREESGYTCCWADEFLKGSHFQPYERMSDVLLNLGQIIRIIGQGREEVVFVGGGGSSIPKTLIPLDTASDLSDVPEGEYFVVLPFGKTVKAHLVKPEKFAPSRLSIMADDTRFGPLKSVSS